MAISQNFKAITMPIGGAINRARFVTVDGSGNAVESAAGAEAIGVTLEGVTAGQYDGGNGQNTIAMAPLVDGNRVPIELAADRSTGDAISSAANGQGGAPAAGHVILGIAIDDQAPSAANDVITMLVQKRITPQA